MFQILVLKYPKIIYFKDFSDPLSQLTLIESENIDDYNTKFGLNISYIDFRRNIITKGIKLNNQIKIND